MATIYPVNSNLCNTAACSHPTPAKMQKLKEELDQLLTPQNNSSSDWTFDVTVEPLSAQEREEFQTLLNLNKKKSIFD